MTELKCCYCDINIVVTNKELLKELKWNKRLEVACDECFNGIY